MELELNLIKSKRSLILVFLKMVEFEIEFVILEYNFELIEWNIKLPFRSLIQKSKFKRKS